MNEQQLEKMRSGRGFIAALDQSGGSTPNALQQYGIGSDAYSDDKQMLELMHEMRTRIITSPSFTGGRILGAILFADTLNRTIDGRSTADYLWNVKNIVPFVKIDKGLDAETSGVRLMKPIPDLDAQLHDAIGHNVFGTKMRSVITLGDPAAIEAVVDQQFGVARQVLAVGLVPIIEPEVAITSPQKLEAEHVLNTCIKDQLDKIDPGQQVMLKLTLPSVDDLYTELVQHPRVLRVAALSGGYDRDDACARLARNHGMIASFSRALTEGLFVDQSEPEFENALRVSIDKIYDASAT